MFIIIILVLQSYNYKMQPVGHKTTFQLFNLKDDLDFWNMLVELSCTNFLVQTERLPKFLVSTKNWTLSDKGMHFKVSNKNSIINNT